MEDMKDIAKLGLHSIEAIAEKFHMSEQLLTRLNPGKKFDHAGENIVVVVPALARATILLRRTRLRWTRRGRPSSCSTSPTP
jgi:hypothetical protein